jgi:hypothetical protein
MADSIHYVDLAVRHADRSATWHMVLGFERTGNTRAHGDHD